MSGAPLLKRVDELGRATLTLNRPELRNAFDDELIVLLVEALKELERSSTVRVVMLAASGTAFSAGADLAWMRRMADYTFDENLADAAALAALMATLAGLKKPTIALVQGPAVAGGLGLVACCDIALATEAATFGLPEVRLGLTPAVISPYVVAAIGARATRRYALTAEAFDAREALRIGLVHELLPDAEALTARADSLTRAILQGGPNAIRATKELLEVVAHTPLDDDLVAWTARRTAETRASEEARGGLAAFFDKAEAPWLED
ncbi:MAG: enoyl-CoA hydratase/isomerase family protein [Actinobacteria bacterium]|nr:enoyl-CoA hydratase/isomerase family protein [Actinomycetota bacterium]